MFVFLKKFTFLDQIFQGTVTCFSDKYKKLIKKIFDSFLHGNWFRANDFLSFTERSFQTYLVSAHKFVIELTLDTLYGRIKKKYNSTICFEMVFFLVYINLVI